MPKSPNIKGHVVRGKNINNAVGSSIREGKTNNYKNDKFICCSQKNVVIYQLEEGKTKIDVKFEDEIVWLSQHQMANLYDTTK